MKLPKILLLMYGFSIIMYTILNEWMTTLAFICASLSQISYMISIQERRTS